MDNIEIKAPKSLIINNKNDLREKLKEGINDSESGNACSLNEAFTEIAKILSM